METAQRCGRPGGGRAAARLADARVAVRRLVDAPQQDDGQEEVVIVRRVLPERLVGRHDVHALVAADVRLHGLRHVHLVPRRTVTALRADHATHPPGVMRLRGRSRARRRFPTMRTRPSRRAGACRGGVQARQQGGTGGDAVGEMVRRGVSLCASGAPRGCERRSQAPPAASCARGRESDCARRRATRGCSSRVLWSTLEHSRAP